jgi:hypothetical protein
MLRVRTLRGQTRIVHRVGADVAGTTMRAATAKLKRAFLTPDMSFTNAKLRTSAAAVPASSGASGQAHPT